VKLTIISPQYKESYTIDWLEVQTSCGTLVIKPGHAPIILTITAPSEFSFVLKTGEKKIVMITRPGFVEVTRTTIIALLNQEIEQK